MKRHYWRRTQPMLSEENVKQIRKEYEGMYYIKEIAARWGVSTTTIRAAIHGEGAYRGM